MSRTIIIALLCTASGLWAAGISPTSRPADSPPEWAVSRPASGPSSKAATSQAAVTIFDVLACRDQKQLDALKGRPLAHVQLDVIAPAPAAKTIESNGWYYPVGSSRGTHLAKTPGNQSATITYVMAAAEKYVQELAGGERAPRLTARIESIQVTRPQSAEAKALKAQWEYRIAIKDVARER